MRTLQVEIKVSKFQGQFKWGHTRPGPRSIWSIQTKFKQISRILRGLRNYEKKGLKEKDQHAGGLDSLD